MLLSASDTLAPRRRRSRSTRWHPSVRASRVDALQKYVINLDAPNKITASDGETRIIGVGEIILIEDVHGKGHLSQAVGQMRRSVMISID